MSMSLCCVDRSMARAAERCQVVERGDAMVTARFRVQVNGQREPRSRAAAVPASTSSRSRREWARHSR